MFFLLLILALLFTVTVAFILARKTFFYVKGGNGLTWAIIGAIIVFAICFCVVGYALGWLIGENIRFER